MTEHKTYEKIFISYSYESDSLSLDIATALTSLLLTTNIISKAHCGSSEDTKKSCYPIKLQISAMNISVYTSFRRGYGLKKLYLAQIKILYHGRHINTVKYRHEHKTVLTSFVLARSMQYIQDTQFQILLKTNSPLAS